MSKARISLGSSTEYTLKYLNVTILKKTDCKDFLRLKRYSSGAYLPLSEVCKCVPELPRIVIFYILEEKHRAESCNSILRVMFFYRVHGRMHWSYRELKCSKYIA